jgi:hypothetical protein
VVLYAARDLLADQPATIVRMESADARDFSADVQTVLVADRPFEAGAIGDPWAVEVNDGVWLYYAVVAPPAGAKPGQVPGIARARSIDGTAGRAFVKDAAPLLTVQGAQAWERSPPRAPSVVRLDDGSFRLFYVAGDSIGEAISADGVSFVRVADNPVLAPSPPVDPATIATGVKAPFDDLAVDDPCVDRVVTPAARVLWRVMYTGRDRRDGAAIGFAGRFGDSGALQHHEGSVFGGRLHGNSPAIARFGNFALLYTNVDENSGEPSVDPKRQVLGVAITPTRIRLPYP